MPFKIVKESRNRLVMETKAAPVYLSIQLQGKKRSHRENLNLKMVAEESGRICSRWVLGSFGEVDFDFNPVDLNSADGAGFKVEVRPDRNLEALLIFQFSFEPQGEKEPYFMIPGTLYGSNNIKNSKSIQPQLNYRGDLKYPKTPIIRTRADRSTHNAVLSVFDQTILAVRGDEATLNGQGDWWYNGLGVDTEKINREDRIEFIMGYHHFPVHYFGKLFGKSISKKPELNYIPFSEGGQFNTSGHIYVSQAEDRFAYEGALEWFYNEIHQEPGNKVDRKKAVTDLVEALTSDAYLSEFHYFPTVLNGACLDTGIGGDTAWTGGLQVVYPMIRASVYYEKARALAEDYIDNLIATGIHPHSGFFYEGKHGDQWNVMGWWKEDVEVYNERHERVKEVHSSYVNGQACCYLLKSYQFYKTMGWEKENLEEWLSTVQKIVDRAMSQLRYDGAIGCYWDPSNGKALTYNTFQGAWFLAATAELYKITKEEKYKDVFYKANPYYWNFVKNVEIYGMPMDTRDAVDEEGNLAYITALKTMHEMTGDKELLNRLIHSLHYEFSWKFAYNTRHVNEPLKTLEWSSCGGSITSSHNIHIHQMGNLIAEEIYYAYQQTGDQYIKSRLKDTLNWGLGTYNTADNHFGFGKRGWATEQFFHSDGIQDDPARTPDGGIWCDYLSWAAACVLLSSSVDIPDEFYI